MPSLDFSDFDLAADQATQTEPDTFTLHGQTFTVADHVSAIPMMRLAKVAAAAESLDGASPERVAEVEREGLVALYDFLEQALAPGEWTRFAELATSKRFSDDLLFKVAQRLYGVITARPTARPTSSSPGGPRISANSSTSSAMTSAGLSPEDLVAPEDALTLLRGVG